MELDSHIDFVMITEIEGMHFQPHRPQGIEFTPTGDHDIRLALLPADPDGDACGSRLGLVCKVYATYPATNDQILFVKSYNDHNVMLRVSDGFTLPFQPKDEILITGDGTFDKKRFRPGRHLCPTDIYQLIERAESELSSTFIYS